jgi:hypothetical protein
MLKKHKHRALSGAILWLAVLTLATGPGCATVSPEDAPPGIPHDFGLPPAGEVLYVMENDRFVILRCAGVPQQGSEYGVFRNSAEVARVRISGQSQPPFWAADIVYGAPAPGDIMKP